MADFQNHKRSLYRMAIISSPLLALYSLAPLIIFMPYLMDNFDNAPKPLEGIAILIPVLFLMIIALLLWVINILLLRFFYTSTSLHDLKWNGWRYVTSFILIFALFGLLINLEASPERAQAIGWYRLVGLFAINSIILLLINLIVTRNEKEELKMQKAQLEISQLTTQKEQLKQQIHPHFLFNALGTLQVLIKNQRQKAIDYTGQLASFLRSSLAIAQQDVLSIKDDLAYFEAYLRLQKMRFGEGVQYEVDIPESVLKTGKLPVFSLQLLAENAIKHNAFTH